MLSSYLGHVLSKKTVDLAPAEKNQVRTLLKDDGEGQAKTTMTAWDTILSLKTKLTEQKDLVVKLYDRVLADKCTCGLSSTKLVKTLIQSNLTQDEKDFDSVATIEKYGLLSKALAKPGGPTSKFSKRKASSQSMNHQLMMTGGGTQKNSSRTRKSMSSLNDVSSVFQRPPKMVKNNSQKQHSTPIMLHPTSTATQRLQEASEFNIPTNPPRNSPLDLKEEESKQLNKNTTTSGSQFLPNLEEINLKFVEETEDRGGPYTTASAALTEKSGDKKRLSHIKAQGSFVVPRKKVSLQFNL